MWIVVLIYVLRYRENKKKGCYQGSSDRPGAGIGPNSSPLLLGKSGLCSMSPSGAHAVAGNSSRISGIAACPEAEGCEPACSLPWRLLFFLSASLWAFWIVLSMALCLSFWGLRGFFSKGFVRFVARLWLTCLCLSLATPWGSWPRRSCRMVTILVRKTWPWTESGVPRKGSSHFGNTEEWILGLVTHAIIPAVNYQSSDVL